VVGNGRSEGRRCEAAKACSHGRREQCCKRTAAGVSLPRACVTLQRRANGAQCAQRPPHQRIGHAWHHPPTHELPAHHPPLPCCQQHVRHAQRRHNQHGQPHQQLGRRHPARPRHSAAQKVVVCVHSENSNPEACILRRPILLSPAAPVTPATAPFPCRPGTLQRARRCRSITTPQHSPRVSPRGVPSERHAAAAVRVCPLALKPTGSIAQAPRRQHSRARAAGYPPRSK
jgi:hypothetical protein